MRGSFVRLEAFVLGAAVAACVVYALLGVRAASAQDDGANEVPPGAPAAAAPVVAHVPNTWVQISVGLDDYRTNAEMLAQGRAALGDKYLLAGSVPSRELNVSLIVEKDEPHVSGAQWRTRFTRGQGTAFDVDGVACVDASKEFGGDLRQANFHAFPVAAGWSIDLHISQMQPTDQPALTKESFSAIARSVRVGVFRRGGFDDYPPAVLDAMHAAAARSHEIDAWAAEESTARPTDWVVPFVHGELLRNAHADDAVCTPPTTRALELLAKAKPTDAKERFVQAVSEEALGLASGNANKASDSIAHFKRGLEIAEALKHPVRADLAYHLACAHARAGSASAAIAALKKAIAVQPGYREAAAGDAAFEKLRSTKEFKALMAPPAAK